MFKKSDQSTVIKVKLNDASATESLSDTEHWLIWSGDLDNPNGSENDCVPDIASDLVQDNNNEDMECPEKRDSSATPNHP
jgi:hypothetical protein